MTRIRLLLAALAVLSATTVAACGDDDETSAGGDGPTVVATSGFAADLVEGVAGEDAEVVQLVPDSSNPHTYSASAKDRATLERADVVVAFGRGYEEGLSLDGIAAERIDIADRVGELRQFAEGEVAEAAHGDEGEAHAGEEEHGAGEEPAGEEKAGGEEEHGAGEEPAGEEKAGGEEHAEGEEADEHGPGSRDPHVWMDPTRMADAAPAVAAMLAKADPENTGAYRRRAAAHAKKLRALDVELREILSAIPEDRRKLVTSHDSLGYFAARYDLEFVGAPFGITPEAQASARAVREVIEQVRREDVPAVFAQEGDDPKVMRQIAKEAEVRIVDDLLIENPGPQGETYAAALRYDARRIAEALGP